MEVTDSAKASAKAKPTETSIGVLVVRCRCGDPWRIHPCHCKNPQEHTGLPCPYGNDSCPQGKKENFGIVSYWHKNPFKRLSYWFRTRILEGRVLE